MILEDSLGSLIILVKRLNNLLKLISQTLLNFPILFSNHTLVIAQSLHHEINLPTFNQHVFLISHIVVQQSGFCLFDGQQTMA